MASRRPAATPGPAGLALAASARPAQGAAPCLHARRCEPGGPAPALGDAVEVGIAVIGIVMEGDQVTRPGRVAQLRTPSFQVEWPQPRKRGYSSSV